MGLTIGGKLNMGGTELKEKCERLVILQCYILMGIALFFMWLFIPEFKMLSWPRTCAVTQLYQTAKTVCVCGFKLPFH